MNATTPAPDPCDRTLFNHELERRALRVLDPADSTLAWIFHGRNGHTRQGVLVQLGHIAEDEGDAACLRAARTLCTPPTPMTTREGEALLRRHRLGVHEPATLASTSTSTASMSPRPARTTPIDHGLGQALADAGNAYLPLSLIGLAVLWSGWRENIELLRSSSLVVKAAAAPRA
jgi:hypothetical protein